MHAISTVTASNVSHGDLAAYLLSGGEVALPSRKPAIVVPAYGIGDTVLIVWPKGDPRWTEDGQLSVVSDILPHDPASHGSRRAYCVRYIRPDGRGIDEILPDED